MLFKEFSSMSQLGAGLILLTLSLSSCSFTHTPKPKTREISRPVIYSPQQILAHLKQQSTKLKNCQTLAHLKIDSWGENKNLKTVVVVNSPSSMRLEFLSFLGQPWQFLVCHKGNFWFYSPLQQKVITGSATRFNLYRLLGINLGLEEIVDILLARASMPKNSSPIRIQYIEGENKYLLQVSDSETGKEQSLWLDANTLKPRQLIIRQKQQLEMEVRWDNYQLIDSFLFPGKINIKRPQDATELNIEYSESKLNQDIAGNMFSLDIPSHAEWVKLPGSANN